MAEAFARKTLGLEPKDAQPIPAAYLAAITELLKRYGPSTTPFLYVEDEGCITCLTCYACVPVTNLCDAASNASNFMAWGSWETHMQQQHNAKLAIPLNRSPRPPTAQLQSNSLGSSSGGARLGQSPPKAAVAGPSNSRIPVKRPAPIDLDADEEDEAKPKKQQLNAAASAFVMPPNFAALQQARTAYDHAHRLLNQALDRRMDLETQMVMAMSSAQQPAHLQAHAVQQLQQNLYAHNNVIAGYQVNHDNALRAYNAQSAAMRNQPAAPAPAWSFANAAGNLVSSIQRNVFGGQQDVKPFIDGSSRTQIDAKPNRAQLDIKPDISAGNGKAKRRPLPGDPDFFEDDSDDEDGAPRTLADAIKHLGKAFEGEPTMDEARAHLGADDDGRIRGMRTPAKPHQLLGISWMLKQEKKRKGGILADDMGLGKTYQTIATCVLNPSKDPERKSTLIIAPRSVLNQWEREIKKHSDKNLKLKVLQYRGADKPTSRKVIRANDFVITTIHGVMAEIPKEEDGEYGPLLRMRWHRVVLDEAHIIRTHTGKWSKAVLHFSATYRWTPIVNTLKDAYALFRFIKLEPWGVDEIKELSMHVFRHERRNPQMATDRMQAILKEVLLRRRKDTMLNGQRLIELRDKTVTLDELQFSADELAVYKNIEAKAQEKVGKYIRQGKAMKKVAHIFAMIVRLRQACCHPALVMEDEEGALRATELTEEEEKEVVERAIDLLKPEQLAFIKKRLLERAVSVMEAGGDTSQLLECSLCYDDPAVDEHILACGHSACAGCLNAVVADAGRKGAKAKCPECRAEFEADRIFPSSAFEPTDKEVEDASRRAGKSKVKKEEDTDQPLEVDDEGNAIRSKKGSKNGKAGKNGKGKKSDSKSKKGKGKKRATSEDEDDDLELVERDISPSRKMLFVKETMDRIEAEQPGAKFVLISSFVRYLDILEMWLEQQGVKTVRFTGQDSDDEREAALEAFAEKPDVKVMLLSLKAGGVGLNLTAANHVIPVDLAWNQASESQAFDRVHRLGQEREVFVHRVAIANTIEQRMLELQIRKGALADGALGEGAGRRLTGLSVKDIAQLFGLDARGRVIEDDD